MDRSLRQTLTYVLTIVTSQGLSFLLLPVVTNYLPPETYGDYALAFSVASLVSTLGSAWIRNVSFPLFFKARSAGRSRSLYLTTAVSQAVVVTVLFTAVSIYLAMTGEYVPLTVFVAAGAGTLANDLYALTVMFVRGEQQTLAFSVSEIGSTLVRFAVTLAGLAVGIRSPVLLFVAPALGAALLGAYAIRVLQKKLTGPASLDRSVLRDLGRFGPASIPFSLGGWGERLMVRIVLDRYLSRAVVGVFSANFALADRIVGGLIQAVFFMAWPDVMRSWSEKGKEAAQVALTRAIRLYLWLTTGPSVFIAIFHRELATMLGQGYREGSEIMPIIAAATWIHGLARFLNRHLELNLRFGTLSAVTLGGAALNLVLSLVLVPRLGVQGAALATLGNFTATIVFFWFIRDRELVRIPWDAVANVALLLAGAFALSRVPVSGYVRALVFAVAYGAGAAFFVLRQFWGKRQVKLAG